MVDGERGGGGDEVALLARPPCPSAAAVAAVEGPLAEIVGILNSATARLTALVAEALRTGAWEQAGIRSPEHWLAWKAGVSGAHARRLVGIARRRVELPVTTAAFDAGSLAEDQVAEIARHVPAAHEAQVAALASRATASQVRTVARRYAFAPPPTDRDEPRPELTPADVRDRDRVRFGFGDDGRWRLHADLGADTGALVQRALEACRDAAFHDAHPDADPDAPTTGVTWADALGRLGEACLVGLAGNRPAGDRHQVIVHVRADQADTVAHLHLGPALPAPVRRLIGCDATFRYLLEDTDGVPLTLGRRQRAFSPAQRTLVEDRYGGACARPGCPRRRGLHLHHHLHWEDGGPTDVDNAIPLCGHDHRLHHPALLHITGDPARPATLTFSDHHGRALPAGAGPVAPDPHQPLTHVAARHGLPPADWQHPTGERLDHWAVTLADPASAA